MAGRKPPTRKEKLKAEGKAKRLRELREDLDRPPTSAEKELEEFFKKQNKKSKG